MKKIFIIIYLSTLSGLVFSQTKLEIFGSTTGVKDGTELSILKVQPKFTIPSSQKIKVIVNSNKFYFSTKQDGAEFYDFELLGKKKGFVLNPGKTEMSIPNGLIKEAVITNDAGDRDYRNFLSKKDSVSRKKYSTAKDDWEEFVLSKNKDSILRDQLWSEVKKVKKEYDRHAVDSGLHWIAKHPKSSINALVLNNFLLDIIPNDQVTNVYNTLDSSVKNNSWGRDLNYKINHLFVGGIAPDFEQTDTSGKIIKLSNFNGKYVLVDFWATWCVPCRLEIPKLIKAKQLLASDNFEIISVSLDDKSSRQKWLDAIKNEKMDWVNLSTLDGFSNVVARKYHIKSIPSSFLIDPNGKILAKNISGEILYKTLKKLVSVR